MIIILLVLSLLSAFLYRAGGASWGHTLWRDIGCTLASILGSALLISFFDGDWIKYCIVYCLVLGLSWASLSTYWDFMFGGEDNLYMHGGMIGLSSIPLAFIGITWWLILIRAVFLALSFGLINKYVIKWGWKHSDVWEECLRGWLIISSLLII